MSDSRDLIINVLELYLNTVIYHRKIYPDGIFRKQRAFDTFFNVCIFPPLQNYFKNILEAAFEALKKGQLKGMDISFYSNEVVQEVHSLNFRNPKSKDNDNLELQIKSTFLRLERNLLSMKKAVPEGSTFKVFLLTNQDSLSSLSTNFPDFPWILDDDDNYSKQEQTLSIHPVTNNLFGIEFLIKS